MIQQGRMEEAKASLTFYNRNPQEVAEETKAIAANIKKKGTINDEALLKERLVKNFQLMRRPSFYLPYFYLQVIFVFIEWSSFPVLAFYLISIFKVLIKNHSCAVCDLTS